VIKQALLLILFFILQYSIKHLQSSTSSIDTDANKRSSSNYN